MGDNTNILLIVALALALVFLFSSCSLKCGSAEGYWSLPFAGGDVRTFAPDPHRIEGPLGYAMDEADMSEENGDYPI